MGDLVTKEMTPDQLKRFEVFEREERRKELRAKRKENKEAYDALIDESINAVFPSAMAISKILGATKMRIYDTFNKAMEMKAGLYEVKNDQQSHTFTSSDGNIRIILGYNQTDNYDDSVTAGIEKVKDFISSLGNDEKSRLLVNGILRLLRVDSKTGMLKASRVLQLIDMARESGNEEFVDGVQIIQSAYKPIKSKQYVRMQFKNDLNEWENVNLGMTEAVNLELDQRDFEEMKNVIDDSLLSFLKSGLK